MEEKKYKNGNYVVTVHPDGSRTRVSEGDSFIPSSPEYIELKITEKYDGQYPWFGSNKVENPRDTKLMENELDPLFKYIKSINPMTEVTISGGYLDHPEILNILFYFRKKNIPVNMIIGQDYFYSSEHKKYYRLLNWYKRRLISHLGVILIDSEDSESLDRMEEFKNTTIIATAGIFNGLDLDNLESHRFNILIKGYYSSDNNKEYSEQNNIDFGFNKSWLVNKIDEEILPAFKTVTFDNLAISQLGIDDPRFTPADEKIPLYLGNDNEFSLYIDMVNSEFSNSPYSKEKYKIEDYMTSDRMFRELRKRRRLS